MRKIDILLLFILNIKEIIHLLFILFPFLLNEIFKSKEIILIISFFIIDFIVDVLVHMKNYEKDVNILE